MAILYRKLHVTFWKDPYVLEELNAFGKLVYNFLITNDKTTMTGIYEISIKYISMHTDIPIEECIKIIKKFADDGKIRYNYDTKELFLLNAMKSNPPPFKNDNYTALIKKELRAVKTPEFIESWFAIIAKLGVPVSFNLDDVLLKEGMLFPPEPGDEKPKKPKKEKAPKAKGEHITDPNIRVIIDHYFKIFEEILGSKPKLGKADAPTVQKELKNMTVEEIKNLIEFVVDMYFRDKPEGKGMRGTLKTCFSPFMLQEYGVEWQKRKWQFNDKEKPITTKRWWR